MDHMKKVVLVHPDKQHSFQTATALLAMGTLTQYITTVYDRPGSLTHLLTKLTKGSFKKKLQAHRSEDIPNVKVKQFTELLSLSLLILVRLDKSKRFYSKVKIFRDKVFNKKVARYCIKHNIDGVISFDVVSAQLYKALGDHQIVKILDMSAPYFPYMCSIFEKEAEKYPDTLLHSTLDTPLFDYWKQQAAYEIANTDAFLVASDFTKKTLTESGADESKIFKCVYGLNHSFFNANGRTESATDTLRCVYVGNVTEQKGCRYLFDVIKKIRCDNALKADFTVVGAYNPADPLIAEASDLCTFTGHILPNQLKDILLNSDIMVFPSLADGFGFSVLEAMACGVVPICSRNAGVSDLIKDGENGFVVDAMDSAAIFEKLQYLNQNRAALAVMSTKAAKATDSVIWENYYNAVKNTITCMLK